jgi:protein-L-isoaspartate(D-aspartate) O-methyltransferase
MSSIEARMNMVARQLAARGIADPRVLDAFREVPREAFIPADLAEFAYDDTPLPIAEGQTISQPYIVALTVEALGLRGAERVLEIGTGSGYAAAILSRLAARWTGRTTHRTRRPPSKDAFHSQGRARSVHRASR